MFLSLSTTAWTLIAAGATLVNLAAMQWIIQIPEYRSRQIWMPVIGAVLVGSHALSTGQDAAVALYFYTALMIMFPLVLAPVRGQITRDYYRWQKDPSTKPGTASMVWMATSLTVLLIAIGLVWSAGRGHTA